MKRWELGYEVLDPAPQGMGAPLGGKVWNRYGNGVRTGGPCLWDRISRPLARDHSRYNHGVEGDLFNL